MAQEPKVGDFVVLKGTFHYWVYEVVGLSQKSFKGLQPGWKEQRKRRDDIRFVGTEEQCRNLAQELNSIAERAESVLRAWLTQHNEKKMTEIAAAIAAATGSA